MAGHAQEEILLPLDLLAGRLIEHKGERLRGRPRLLEEHPAHEYRNPLAVFPQILFFKRLNFAGRQQFLQDLPVVFLMFWWRQRRVVQASGCQVLSAVAQQLEKGVVGLLNAPHEIRDRNAYEIGLHQATEPCFALSESLFRLFAFVDITEVHAEPILHSHRRYCIIICKVFSL